MIESDSRCGFDVMSSSSRNGECYKNDSLEQKHLMGLVNTSLISSNCVFLKDSSTLMLISSWWFHLV
jgi:hypothetical protein